MSYDDRGSWTIESAPKHRHEDAMSWPEVSLRSAHSEQVVWEGQSRFDRASEGRESGVAETASHRAELEFLAAKWREDTFFTSSETDRILHPAYQRIIGFGRDALPFLLGKVQDGDGNWYHALRSITGEDPVRREDRGDVAAMRRAWITWSQQVRNAA